MVYSLEIVLNKISNIDDLLSKLNRMYYITRFDTLHLKLVINGRVNPEYLVIIVGIVNFLRVSGATINVTIENLSENNYPQRMNFHKALGVQCCETFNRYDAQGRFVEITNFDASNSVPIINNILKVIRDNWAIDGSIYQCLNYCLFEMIDNIQNHADSPINGYTVAQNFRYSNHLKFVILDAGKGIHESLIENPIYRNLTPEQALECCIKEKVTNGKGMGYGLFHTSQFILANGGELYIHSGNHVLEVINQSVNVRKSFYWRGTLIYVKINTNNSVSFNSVFGANIPETVANADDYIDDNLW